MLIEISIIFAIISFLAVYLQMPFLIKFMKEKGKVGKDVHKEEKPEVAEMGGLSIIFSLILLSIMLYFLTANLAYLVVISVAAISGFIGILDDLFDLGGKLKPTLTLFASIPILITGLYNPHPSLPFLPSTRLTLIYPILIPIGIAISSNAVNMLDVVNGATPLLLMPVFIAFIIISLIFSNHSLIPIASIMLAALIAFYLFNKYPARAFMGNCGDFFIGGFIGALAIVYSLEVVTVIAMLPYAMHGFYALSSVRRFFEKKEIKEKPVIFKNGLLYASKNEKAPMTLMRIILAKGPLKEKEIANIFFILACVSSILSIITYILTKIRI